MNKRAKSLNCPGSATLAADTCDKCPTYYLLKSSQCAWL